MKKNLLKSKKIEDFLPGLEKNVSLKKHTTFKIGGLAKYFIVTNTKDDLVRAVIAARESKTPFFILGHGSNVLMPDRGFKGLIIKNGNKKYKITQNKIYADSGVMMNVLVEKSAKKSLAGLEWAGGLPGTLGGAIRGNAGAFGGEIKNSILEVEFIDNKNIVRKLSNEKCFFGYRSSIFKKKEFIILSATIKLKKGNKKKLLSVVQNHIDYRKKYHPLNYPNAGSMFKNYDFKKASPKVRKIFKDVVKTDPFPIIPVALIILKAKLSGKTIGRAQISKKHSNYIVNLGGATANDVKKLINFAKKNVKQQFDIKLEEEVKIL